MAGTLNAQSLVDRPVSQPQHGERERENNGRSSTGSTMNGTQDDDGVDDDDAKEKEEEAEKKPTDRHRKKIY